MFPDFINELDDFTMQEVREVALGVKKVTATAYDDIPAEAWKLLDIKNEGVKILTKLFNMIVSKKENIQKKGKLHSCNQFMMGNVIMEGIHCYQFWRKYTEE